MKIALAATVAAMAVLALIPRVGAAADPYNIYVIAAMTGPSAFLGTTEAAALKVIEDQTNKAGGVRGRPIHFIVQDDQSIATNAVQLLNQTMAQKVPVILGSSLVSACSAMAPVAANGPVVFCFSPGVHPPAGGYMFSSSISTADYIVASIRYLNAKGLHKVAVISSNDATGQDGDRSIDAAIALPEMQGQVSVVDREHFNSTDLSVAAQMARIKASGAQTAILWAVGTPFGTLLRDAASGGLEIPLITSAGNLNANQLAGYDSFMPDNLLMTAPPWVAPSQFPNPAFRKYLTSYLNAFKAAGIDPQQGESLAWDPAMMVLDALRKYGFDATPAQIRDYIAGLKGWMGVNGAYDFQAIPQRGIGIDGLVMVRWDKKSKSFVGVSKPGGF
jgi:branched-chain amino acid transport system substrate-binding protein